MIDSDFENVSVDDEFERLRHNLEVPSTLGDDYDQTPKKHMMTVRSFESMKRKMQIVEQE